MSLEHSRHFKNPHWKDKYPDILITRNELAEMLGISRGTIDVWVSTKRVRESTGKYGKSFTSAFNYMFQNGTNHLFH